MDIFAQDKWTPFELAAYTGDFSAIKMPAERYSATTTKNHVDCNRKYYWQYVLGIDPGPSAAQAFGTRGHKASEVYLKTGEPPHTQTIESSVARAGVEHMPKPFTPGLKVEESFTVKWGLPGGAIINVTGTADAMVEPQDKDADTFELYDHKFIKDMKYAMSKGDLSGDVQANLYSHVLFERFRTAGFKALEFVNKTWIYYQKTPQKDGSFLVRPTKITSTRAQVAHVVDKVIEPAFVSMHALRQEKPRLFDVPYNESACGTYGGCPHRQRCFSPKAMEFKTMGIISKQAGSQPVTTYPTTNVPVTKDSIVAKAAAIRTAPAQINPPAPAAVEAHETVQAAYPEPGQIEEAPKRTRRTKAEMQQAAADAINDVSEQASNVLHLAQQAPTVPDNVRARALGYNPAHGYWLFVGCAPTQGFTGKVHNVAELTAQAALDANSMAKKEAHYRMEFGGHGLLQAAFDRWMTDNAIKGAVVIPAGSVAGQNVIDSLRVHAQLVIERTGLGA